MVPVTGLCFAASASIPASLTDGLAILCLIDGVSEGGPETGLIFWTPC